MKHRYMLFLAALFYSGAALAHPGHAGGVLAGLLHPLTGIDHVLAMLAVGLWAAQLGRRAQWLLPLGFLASLAVGGALGMAGVAPALVETGIITSVLLLGLLVGFAVRLSLLPALSIIGAFALFHGLAHGTEMPVAESIWLYAFGFMAASAALHGIGVWLGRSAALHERWLRAGGAAIALAGVWLAIAR